MSTPTGTRRRLTREQRREALVATTVRLARERGILGLTAREIALAGGVASGLMHHYFASVDELVTEAFERLVDEDLDEISAYVVSDDAPIERLHRLMVRFFDPCRQPLQRVWLDAWSEAQRRPALRTAVERQMRAWQDLLAELVIAGVDAGCFQAAEPVAAGHRILILLDGSHLQLAISGAAEYPVIFRLTCVGVERELGLRPGTLPARLPEPLAEAGGAQAHP